MIGTAMKISLPHGTVYLVAKPSTQYAFEPIGRVDRGKLTFPLGNNMIEIVSKSNIFKTRETGIVWILRDSEAKTDGAISLAAGTPETVLPKK
jgi:hypothetical protein